LKFSRTDMFYNSKFNDQSIGSNQIDLTDQTINDDMKIKDQSFKPTDSPNTKRSANNRTFVILNQNQIN